MKNPEITLQENIDVHCKYINTALDNLYNTEISFESVNQITGFLCAYDAFIIDFVYCIEPNILKDFEDKFVKICKKFNIDYSLFNQYTQYIH